ncbi:MAG TPA: thiamine pyrophosphate-dependent enzyme [Candidatus Ozemobacteraceae bacterium]
MFDLKPGDRAALTGAGAAALGAYEAGVGFVTTYPGSPITETFDLLADPANPRPAICRLSINEHVAFHAALGFSLAGGRSLVTMKHVGFNVAADPAHYAGYTGIRGGMVILIGTDPGATCSTGEYDVRFYAFHTHLPLLEPASGQDVHDILREAFAWSEADGLPYVVAIPAGTCYGIEGITAGPARERQDGTRFEADPDLTNVGRRAVANHARLLAKLDSLKYLSTDRHLFRTFGSGHGTLILTSGAHLARVREAVRILKAEDDVMIAVSLLTHPYPTHLLDPLLREARRIVFVEDLGGPLEFSLSRFLLTSGGSFEIHGKDLFPAYGALDLGTVTRGLAAALGRPAPERGSPCELPEREGTFCPGCAYRPFFHALTEALGPDGVIGGDIGCSSLPPHFSSWLTCMNSGTSIAAGVTLAVAGRQTVVSLIGDSTLLHSGLQTILEAAATDSNQVCFVLYNHWTAMTGHQELPVSPRSPDGTPVSHLDIQALLRSLGVRSLELADPTRLDAFRSLLKRVLAGSGFRVVLVERECRLQERRRPDPSPWKTLTHLEAERCRECGVCYERFSCPAIIPGTDGIPSIDEALCTECGVCRQVCPHGAIFAARVKRP